jgi:flagellar basal body-associated protein FliL
MKKQILMMMVVMVCVLCASFVIAQVPTYHQFYGETKNHDGTNLTESMQVEVYIDVELKGTVTSSNGKYGYNPLFFVENGQDGQTIKFYINDVLSGNYTFQDEQTTYLDLVWPCGNGQLNEGEECDGSNIPKTCSSYGYSSGSLTCTSHCKISTSQCTSGGSTGGSRRGSSGVYIPPACQENWTCIGWSECIDGVQTRNCTDQKNCSTTTEKPITAQSCVTPEMEITHESIDPVGTTEAEPLLERADWMLIIIIAVIVITIVAVVFLILRKRKLRKQTETKPKKTKKGPSLPLPQKKSVKVKKTSVVSKKSVLPQKKPVKIKKKVLPVKKVK